MHAVRREKDEVVGGTPAAFAIQQLLIHRRPCSTMRRVSRNPIIRKMPVDYCFPEILGVCRNGKYILDLDVNKYRRTTREVSSGALKSFMEEHSCIERGFLSQKPGV